MSTSDLPRSVIVHFAVHAVIRLRVEPEHPLPLLYPPLSIHFLIFYSFLLFLFSFLIRFISFLLLSIPSLYTRIVHTRKW